MAERERVFLPYELRRGAKPTPEFIAKVDQVVDFVFGGFHHVDKPTLETGTFFTCRPYSELATWDYSQLTKLVVVAHELCVRAAIRPASGRVLKVCLSPRAPLSEVENKMVLGHPTLAEHLEKLGPLLPGAPVAGPPVEAKSPEAEPVQSPPSFHDVFPVRDEVGHVVDGLGRNVELRASTDLSCVWVEELAVPGSPWMWDPEDGFNVSYNDLPHEHLTPEVGVACSALLEQCKAVPRG